MTVPLLVLGGAGLGFWLAWECFKAFAGWIIDSALRAL